MIEQQNIRLARLADAGQIAVMSRDLIEQGLGWSWTRARVSRAIRDPECNVIVMHSRSRIVGFGIMEYGWQSAHLVLFAVRPEARKQRVGTRLVAWLEETVRIAGLERVNLETRLGNTTGRRFYQSCGYREIGVVRGYYSGRESAVRMTHELRIASP